MIKIPAGKSLNYNRKLIERGEPDVYLFEIPGAVDTSSRLLTQYIHIWLHKLFNSYYLDS